MIQPSRREALRVTTPDPMADDRIDGAAAQNGYEQIAAKPHAFSGGARDDRGSRSTKGELKEEERPHLGVGSAVEEKLRGAK